MFSHAASSNDIRKALEDERLQKLISDIDSSPDALNVSDVIPTSKTRSKTYFPFC